MNIDKPTSDELRRLGNEQWAAEQELGVTDEVIDDVYQPLRDVSYDSKQDALKDHPSSRNGQSVSTAVDSSSVPVVMDAPVKLRLAEDYKIRGRKNLPKARAALQAAIKPDPEVVRREAANAALTEHAQRMREQKAVDAAKAIVESQKDNEE